MCRNAAVALTSFVAFALILFCASDIRGEDPANALLARAERALNDGDKTSCWRAIDLARSNYPHCEPQAQKILKKLDAVSTDPERAGRVSIETWHQGKQSALSCTFDDGLSTAYQRGAPDLERHEWRGTFYLYNQGTPDPTPWKQLAIAGHELGSHTVSHYRDLPDRPPCVIRREIRDSCTFLREITGERVITFAYPQSRTGPRAGHLRSEVRRIFLCGRTGRTDTPMATTPPEMDAITSTPMWTDTPTLEEVEEKIDRAVDLRAWLVLMFHGIGVQHGGWEPVTEEKWEGCLRHAHAQRAKLWVAPTATVTRYVIARRTASVTSSASGPDELHVAVRCGLPDLEAKKTRLTIRVRVPGAWKEVTISGEAGHHTVRDAHVTFEIVPNGKARALKHVQGT